MNGRALLVLGGLLLACRGQELPTSPRAAAAAVPPLISGPSILGVSPRIGRPEGGEIVRIIGHNFSAPVRVFFEIDGTKVETFVARSDRSDRREGRVLQVDYSQIAVETPSSREVGPADVIVHNILGGGESRLANTFRYIESLRITSISPTHGPATGGTHIHITGSGFQAPLAVTIGGVLIPVLTVSGTSVRALTAPAGCNADGPLQVTNLATGETATGPLFEFRCPRRRAA